MRLHPAVAAVVVMLVAPPVSAQEWIEYVSRQDRVTANFPGEPTVTETTYVSQFGAALPARVYAATQGASRYSLTVVDYRDIERILEEKARSCPEGAETCRGGLSSTGPGYSWADRAGAMIYASWQFIRRDAEVTQFIWTNINQVVGYLLHLTNRDESRTYVSMFMHENRLYITEGTVPAGHPEPGLFQQSLGWLDENGNPIRYLSHYVNGQPAPARR